MKQLDTIIWDWNGTLLDDVDLCIDSINLLLGERGHPGLAKAAYRDIFTFPVRDYYVRAGFDFDREPFDEVAVQFIDLYRAGLGNCTVFPAARASLERITAEGYRQFLISAMEHRFLMESLRACEVDHYFEDFSGIQDHYADGKLAMAMAFIRNKGIDPRKTLFIGDTLHDHEVADRLGMHCLLVAQGHQSEALLRSSGCDVVRDLEEAVSRFSEWKESDIEITENNKQAL